MSGVSTSIAINAPIERVWAILTDFAAYPKWNPLIPQISGELRKGAQLDVLISIGGEKPDRFKPVVQTLTPGKEFSWLGSLPVPGMFSGRHGFQLRPEPKGVSFIHSEQFSGLLVPLFSGTLKKTEATFNAMNAALKTRAEART